MASTKPQSRTSQAKASTNGKSIDVGTAAKDAGETAASIARRARGPMLAAGAAAAGLAGGLAVGSLRRSKRRGLLVDRRPKLLGMRLGPKGGALRTVELLRDSAKHLDSATSQLSGTTEDVRELRQQLDQLNRRSPLEVVLDGLTHRRGAHRREG
jgi:hypothetical protein